MVNVAVVAPAYTPPFETLAKVLPLSVLTCHLYVGDVPAATTVKLVTLSVHTAALTGCVVIVTGMFTVTVTCLEADVQPVVGYTNVML